MIRKERKSRKKYGKGKRLGKKRRGAGNRGGRGRAGWGKRGKHRKIMFLIRGERPGKKGFTSKFRKLKIINVRDIDERIEDLVAKGIAEKQGAQYSIDVGKLGYEVVGSKGSLSKKIKIIARNFTPKAIEKIKRSGGEAVSNA